MDCCRPARASSYTAALAARIEALELTLKLNGGHAKLPALIRSYEEIASLQRLSGQHAAALATILEAKVSTCWVESSGIVVFPAPCDPVNS